MSSLFTRVMDLIQWIIGQTFIELMVYGILIILGGAFLGYLGILSKNKK